jgi:SagB-type dehydrogenase family enzyme
VYHYRPRDHVLIRTGREDRRADLAAAALNQSWVQEGAVVITIVGVYGRTTKKYGDRGIRYTHIEVGHAAQNVYLQAEALDLGTVIVGAFDDQEVRDILDLSDREQPLALLPVGRIHP